MDAGDSPRGQFAEAQELARTGQSARATRLLVECVCAEPGDAALVQALLEHLDLQKPTGDNGQAAAAEPPPELVQALAAEDWGQVQKLAPRYLAVNAEHVPTLTALAQACAANGQPQAELCYLERAARLAPEDPQIQRRLGRALARQRRFEESLACWRKVEEIDDAAGEAAAIIAALTTELSRERCGLASPARDQWLLASDPNDPGRNHRAVASPAKPALPGALAAISGPGTFTSNLKRTPIQELEIAIREFPSNAAYYLQIVPLYLEAGRDYDAEKLLAKGRSATSNDPRVCELWEDVTMLRTERKLALAQKHAQELDSAEARNELTQIVAERDQLETEIFVSRCQREPHNAAVRIELAKRLRRSGKLREACQRLEEALRDAVGRCPAALELGECHLQQGDAKEALRYYRLAADSAHQPEHLVSKKQALYHAGGLAAQMKLRPLAERYLAELVGLDPNYKDASAILADVRRQAAAVP